MRLVFTVSLLISGFASAQTPANPQLLRPPTPVQPKVSGPVCAYPDGALRAGIDERTLLEFHVNADGQIIDTVVLDSSGNAVLNEAALHCFRNWHADSSEAAGFGSLRAHIFWNLPAGVSAEVANLLTVGTFSVVRLQTCDGFYPPDEANTGIGGSTFVRFHITASGEVGSPEVVQSSGDAVLDQAAISCVQHWRYQPATKNGVAVDFVKETKFKWNPR
ncbi:MAG: energy transducer TonB [Proteobacteria bacterium]|nr:energy transducer TonB [Pseudomonadota bacterium]